MPLKPEFPLRVFYDGACSVCAVEAERYGMMDRERRLILVDISAAEFDPVPLGFTQDDFMRQMHAIDRNGRVYRGVDAFWAIWQAFPGSTFLGFLGALLTLPVVNRLARGCYWCFARIRRFLPKRDAVCTSGSCRIGRHGS